MTPLLEVENLKIHFPAGRNRDGSPRVVHAVDGLSFSVGQGSTFGIVGESGSGKSTAALGIMRLAPITSGRISLGRDTLSELEGEALRQKRMRFQMVFQDPFSSLNPRKRAGDAIREPLDLMHYIDPKLRKEVVEESLVAVGLHPSAARLFPHQFSGGQRQRLCIARALATQPELLVCDEPVSALDVAIQAQVINLLLRLQDEKKLTYVFISHDLAVVQHLCTDIGVMYLGQFAERGPAATIFSNPRHPYTWSLMAAALKPDAGQRHRDRSALIRGEPPSPIDPPAGCRFAARCPFARDRCRAEAPALREIEAGHAVACHFAETLEAPLPELQAA